jgi:hypothetical protein
LAHLGIDNEGRVRRISRDDDVDGGDGGDGVSMHVLDYGDDESGDVGSVGDGGGEDGGGCTASDILKEIRRELAAVRTAHTKLMLSQHTLCLYLCTHWASTHCSNATQHSAKQEALFTAFRSEIRGALNLPDLSDPTEVDDVSSGDASYTHAFYEGRNVDNDSWEDDDDFYPNANYGYARGAEPPIPIPRTGRRGNAEFSFNANYDTFFDSEAFPRQSSRQWDAPRQARFRSSDRMSREEERKEKIKRASIFANRR